MRRWAGGVIVSIAIRVAPFAGFAPADVGVVTAVTPQDGVACLVVDSEDYYTSSCWDLTPETPTQRVTKLRGLPAGHYGVTLTVQDLDKTTHVTTAEFEVSK